MATITNTSFDALITSESATLTRVTDIDSDFPPANNSHIPVKCTTDNGAEVYISYDNLGTTAIWTKLVRIADGHEGVIDDLQTKVSAVDTQITGYGGAPRTAAEWKAIIDAMRERPDTDAIHGV